MPNTGTQFWFAASTEEFLPSEMLRRPAPPRTPASTARRARPLRAALIPEALNEVPLGLDWPPVAEQQRRLEQTLEAITRLWDGRP